MDKLIEYICDELDDIEKKADKDGKLSMTEIQYADTLAHLKKNILKAEEMTEGDSYSYARGRNARRDSRGRYSRERSNRGGSYEGSYEGSYDGSYDGSYENRGGSNRGNSNRGSSYRDNSYRGGSYGYSRDESRDEMLMRLREMEQDADEQDKYVIRRWIKQLEES